MTTTYQNSEVYTHKCDYLSCLVDKKHATISDLKDITMKMMIWLSRNVSNNGEPNYVWSNGYNQTTVLAHGASIVVYSSFLYFAYEEDMLAFNLTFGIH